MSIFYDFVDFLKPQPFNEKGSLTGKMVLNIKTLTPLFIGSGYEEREVDMLYKSFQRCGEKPVIPGSTLKGVLRTVSQAVSYSCVDVSRSIQRDLPFQNDACNCIVCKTYGKMGLKGRVNFGDFVMREGNTEIIKIPLQMSPNIDKRDVYYKNGKLRGIKFYRHGDYRLLKNAEIPVEAVKAGSEFEGEIVFQGVHKSQLELLCCSMGLDGSFCLKVGGNKSGFFGSCVLSVKEAAFIGGEVFSPAAFAESYGKDDSAVSENKLKLSEILNYNNRINAL